MKYRAVIFDWDGTLVDSTGRIVESMQLAAQDLQLSFRSDHEIKQIIGLGLSEAIVTLWPELGIEDAVVGQLREAYGDHYSAEARQSTDFYPFARQLLESIKDSGAKLAVATGKSRRGLELAFEELGVRHWFDHSRCADETRSKPHPLMLEELSEAMALPMSEMVMIGDTEFDLNMASAAGMDSVGLTHGAHSVERLIPCTPKVIVDNLKAVKEWLSA